MTNSEPKDLPSITVKVHTLLSELTSEDRHKVVSAVMTLFGDASPASVPSSVGVVPRAKFTKSLATYLSEKQAHKNQVLRFLVTADWLRLRGVTPLNTKTVTDALRNNNQSRIGNPPDILNKNAAKGLLEKEGKNFFITSEGLSSLGHRED